MFKIGDRVVRLSDGAQFIVAGTRRNKATGETSYRPNFGKLHDTNAIFTSDYIAEIDCEPATDEPPWWLAQQYVPFPIVSA